MLKLIKYLLIVALALAPLNLNAAGFLLLTKTAAGGGSITLDGTAVGNNVSSGTTNPISLFSTTQSNDIIIVSVFSNGTNTIGVSGSTLGTFAQRATSFGSSGSVYTFWKLAASPVTNETITVTFAAATTFSTAVAFAVRGVGNTAAPFDPNVAVPAICAYGAGGCAMTLTNANDFAFVVSSINSATSTPSTGFTALYNNNFFLVEYKNNTGTVTASDPAAGGNVMVGDALTP